MSSQLLFGANESLVQSPFFSLAYNPEQPFTLGNENGNHTPWADWRCDRFRAFLPLEAFTLGSALTEEQAVELAQHHQGFYSFDGSLAYIPASHAEDFFQHLDQFVRKGLSGMGIPQEDRFEDELNLGSDDEDLVGYWGATTSDGLFLLFASSADTLGEDWLESAWRRYPRQNEITLPADATAFDPAFAFFYADAHLADNLTLDRVVGHDGNEQDPARLLYRSFLSWAHNKGYLKSLEG